MKAYHLTSRDTLDIQAHPLYQEAYRFGLELNKLTEGKSLTTGNVSDIFRAAEKAMTDAGTNRTLLGKAGDLAGALGEKIRGLGKALQDTSPVQGIDAAYQDLKNLAGRKLQKSPEGSKVLRMIDTYAQTVQRYPSTGKFFWGVAGVLTGLLTSGAAPIVMLGLAKTIDGMLQNKQLSTSVGGAAAPVGAALGAKALAGAGKAIANTEIPDFDNPFKPNPPGPDNVVPPSPDNVVPPGPDNVNPPSPDNVVPPGGETQVIKAVKGDTLSGISAKYKVNPDELAKLNPGKFGPQGNPNILQVGDEIVLPKNIDATAYKGPYSGDNAMTAQNIQNKMDTGQYGSDQGMAAKRIAADAAAAKAKTASAQTPTPSAQNPAPSGQDPFGGRTIRTEAVKVIKGRGILEGFDIITAPTSVLVDREATVRKWALNESLNRGRGSVQLTETGVRTVFANVERLYEFVLDEAGTVFNRPANANDPEAMAKNAATAADNTRTDAGPVGKLPGGNVGGLATGDAPAGQSLPYLAADPEGKFKTKGKGPLGGALMRGIEDKFRQAGNYVGDLYKEMGTKVTYNGLMRHWQDAGKPADSDAVAQVLVRKKVPAEVIKQIYSQLNFPEPKLDTPAAAATAATADAGTAEMTDDELIALTNQALAGKATLTPAQKERLDAIRQRQGLRPVDVPVDDGTSTVRPTATTAGGTTGGTTGGTGGTGTGGVSRAAMGDGQQSQATEMILPQIARMTGTMYADDLITIIDTAMSVLSRSAPTAYREKLAQFRGTATGKATDKAQDIIQRTKKKKNKSGSQPQPAPGQLGPTTVIPGGGGTANPQPATGTNNESRRVYGGKYIRESADTKLAREFEKFIITVE